MAKNKQTNNLKKMMWSADDLFKNQEERDDEQRERIYDLNLKDIEPFPNHPFKVRNDDEMNQLAESIKDNGIIVPIIVRPIDGGKYQTVAGHRRSYASKLAGKKTIPAIVRNLTDDEATILMVDSNNQRETLLPSEKAFAYKMRLDAIKRQGKRTDLTSAPVGSKLGGARSNLELAAESPDSKTQIQRYIRLTYLAPELLSLVDEGRIKMRPAVEISYLHPESQKDLIECTMIQVLLKKLSLTTFYRQTVKQSMQNGLQTLIPSTTMPTAAAAKWKAKRQNTDKHSIFCRTLSAKSVTHSKTGTPTATLSAAELSAMDRK